MAEGENALAERESRRAVAALETILSADHPQVSDARSSLAEALLVQGRAMDAETVVSPALTRTASAFGPSHPGAIKLQTQLARSLLAQSRLADAMEASRSSASPLVLSAPALRRQRQLERVRVEAAWLNSRPDV